MKNVAAGQLVFAVYEGYRGAHIESAVVEKVTEKQIMLARAGIAFHCHRRYGREHDFALSPAEAWEQWKAALGRKRASLVSAIAEIDTQLTLVMPTEVYPS